MKLFDKKNKRLVVLKEKATPEFWSKHWQTNGIKEKIKAGQDKK